jgi:hypothetical protein
MELKNAKVEVLNYTDSNIVEGNDKYNSILQILVEVY